MFSHITVGTNNLSKATIFYSAVLLHLGFKQREVMPDGGPLSSCWVDESSQFPSFYVYELFNVRLRLQEMVLWLPS